ncbi:unnamed protein product [Dicrocoelium dendriticum]|nr:unnamed protein product [Dicrocoelium dendriticum]
MDLIAKSKYFNLFVSVKYLWRITPSPSLEMSPTVMNRRTEIVYTVLTDGLSTTEESF